ncbi:MAG: DUF2232 domain-containing protein [Clostridia bacterium]|nr:DUF2232 domain-containing protein [Clostridia bacterium]
MQRSVTQKGGWKGILTGLICGLVLGFFLTVLPSLLLLYPILIIVGTITMMTLQLRFGISAFMTAALAAVLMGSMFLSPLMGILYLVMVCVPAFVTSWMIRSGKPFVRLIMTGTIASLLGQVAALLLYQILVQSTPIKDFVDALVSAVRDVLPAAALEPYGPILSTLLDNGYLTAPAGYIPGQALSGEILKEVFCSLLSMLEETYAAQAPAAMLTAALYSGIPGIFLAVHMAFWKRVGQHSETILPPHFMLRIPPSLSFLLLAGTAVLFVLYLTNVVSYIIFNAIWTGIIVLYALQGVSVLCFFLQRRKVSFLWQAVLAIIGLMLFRFLFFLLGLVEQSFYLRGIGRPAFLVMRRGSQDNSEEDQEKKDRDHHDPDRQ